MKGGLNMIGADGSATVVVPHGRARRSRVLAMLVAAIMTVSLVGGCGSKPGLDAQKTEQTARADQVNALAAQEFRNQVAAAMKRAAAQRLARQRRAAAQRRAARQRRAVAQRLARQRQAVAQRLARQRQAVAQRLARQRQAKAISAAIQSKTADASQVLLYFGLSPFDLCGPLGPNGGGKAQRQARRIRELRRKQALRYLNLSCPPR